MKGAAVRSLEVIGEASKNIPGDFKTQHPAIPWRNMAGMRDKLIHDYMGVNYSIVWDVLRNKIPTLHIEITEVLNKETNALKNSPQKLSSNRRPSGLATP